MTPSGAAQARLMIRHTGGILLKLPLAGVCCISRADRRVIA